MVPLNSLHVTILAFRMENPDDISKWEKVLEGLKKPKIQISGANIFAVKK